LVPDRALEKPGEDLLNHRALVSQLVRLVMEVDASVSIALFGPWGSGKSSVGKFLQNELAKHGRGLSAPIVRFVRYDAWRFAGVSLQRSFITEAAHELGLSEARYHSLLYQDLRTAGVNARRLLRALSVGALIFPVVLAFCVALLVGVAVLVSFTTSRGPLAEIAHQAPTLLPAATLVALFTAVLRPFLDAGAYQRQEAAPTAAEQFRRTFERLIDDALKRARKSRPRAWIETSEHDRDRVVFFIDELDRCSSEEVVEALRAMKTFLDAKHCVFVVAADRDVIESALDKLPQATPTNEEAPYYSTAGAFLDKVFQYQLTLPPLRGRRLTRFARDLVERQRGLWADLGAEENGRVLDEVVYTLIPSHVRSPRRVKVLLNRYAANVRIAEANGIEWLDRAEEIAKLTVLETEFPQLAADLRLLPELPAKLLDPPDRPSPLLALLLARHGLLEGESGTGIPVGARASARLLVGGQDVRLIRTQRAELRRYLERTSEIKKLGRDLLYLETVGKAVGLEDAELAEAVEEHAPEAPGKVIDRLRDRGPDEQQKAALMLAEMTETSVARERRNVLTALLRTVELLGEDEARPIAWRVVAAIRIFRMTQRLPSGLAPAALEAAEWSQDRSSRGEHSADVGTDGRDERPDAGLKALTVELLDHEELWRSEDAVRRVARLAATLDLEACQNKLGAGVDQHPEALIKAVTVLTQDGIERLLALPAVYGAIQRRIEEPEDDAHGPVGAILAHRLYEAGTQKSTSGLVSYIAEPLLLHLRSPLAYHAVFDGVKSGIAPSSPAELNRLALLALRQAPPADWSFWTDKLAPLAGAGAKAEESSRALAVLAQVFRQFRGAKVRDQDAATELVRGLATLAGKIDDEAAGAPILSALGRALRPTWWQSKDTRATHTRLHRAARELRRARTTGTEAGPQASAFIAAVDKLLVDDLEAAVQAGAVADEAVLSEVVELAGQLPSAASKRVLDQLSDPARWRRAGEWRDMLRALGADEATLAALYARVRAPGDPMGLDRLAEVFAPISGTKSPTVAQTVAVAVRLASELGGAATQFAARLLPSLASTAPDEVREAYQAEVDAGKAPPHAIEEAVLKATAPSEEAVVGDDASHRLRVMGPTEMATERLGVDVVVVGSGAAGSMVAARVAASGRRVLVIERGPLIEQALEEEPLAAIQRAAAELLVAEDVSVYRGVCVGGPTLFSNGIASDPPERIISQWNDPRGADAGLDEARLRMTLKTIRDQLGLPVPGVNGHRIFSSELMGAGLVVDRSAGRRLSTVHTVLPNGQQGSSGGFEILSECRVERLIAKGRRVVAVECRLGDGRDLHVDAETVVVAAGAIDSSLLLQSSALPKASGGTGIGFNVSCLLLVEREHAAELGSDRHYVELRESELVVEDGLDGSEVAVAGVPSWFADYAAGRGKEGAWQIVAVSVGSHSTGSVLASPSGSAELHFTLDEGSRSRLVEGLALVAGAALDEGARRVLLPTRRPLDLRDRGQLKDLGSFLSDAGSLVLTSNQPQGGAAMSHDPAKGVVDETLRVHGVDNLYVCDASVLPTPLGVYPQLTVMALAEMAAQDLVGERLTG
jgi:choline dehydrogenase-like flavoprotein